MDTLSASLNNELRRVGLNGLLGLATEQAVAQQLDLLFEIDDLALIDRALHQYLRKHLLEQYGFIGEVFGHGNHAVDYTESGDKSRCQNLMRAIAPEVKTIE